MNNFDFLRNEKKFEVFANRAIAAEQSYNIDTGVCISVCRQAMEFAIKWMYSVDSELKTPYQDNLATLMSTSDFRDIVNEDIIKRLELIRKLGNTATHSTVKYSKDEAALALENLFYFCDFIDYCYGTSEDSGVERTFNKDLLEQKIFGLIAPESKPDIALERLIAENEALKSQLTARRQEQEKTFVGPKPIDESEYVTRKIYIDTMLRDVSWVEGKNWINEYPIKGMPLTSSDSGAADYVLFGDDGIPLAVIEAKKTSIEISQGREQGKLYAGLLEKEFGRRPVIFLTNGFDTSIIDGDYPERKVSNIYSKRDLEKQLNLKNAKISLKYAKIDDRISDRYYQKAAIESVCEVFQNKKRKALLVMATGSGKTRTIISLVDLLIKNKWIKNVLFLADRNSLVTQAERAFLTLLPSTTITNLVTEKNKLNSRCVFSTYQTMINLIDDATDEYGNKLFSCGHFDLIIVDEAHRSIYKKYREIFTYFDSLLVGLTATPKNEIDFNTYRMFDLENGIPTYGYELAQAVTDKYLVSYKSVESKLKFLEEGIVYDQLSDTEKEEYEEKFTDENDEIPDKIQNTALNNWVFNIDTIREVLHLLMTRGIRVDEGSKIGKTIIFAKSRRHAEEIYKVFGLEYPNLPSGFCEVIHHGINYAQNIIDKFTTPRSLPQIAISVDMLDTGIDVPECVNLVFFKKVMSKSKFWQMIGRGTRLCKGLIDGIDKSEFLIFDFCGNFEFFRISGPEGSDGKIASSIQERIFSLKLDICYKLQKIIRTEEFLDIYYQVLINELGEKVRRLNRSNFAVKQHLRYVVKYSDPKNYENMTFGEVGDIKEHLASLIDPYEDEIDALRFDSQILYLEWGLLENIKSTRIKRDVYGKLNNLLNIENVPSVTKVKEDIKEILHTDYLERATLEGLEKLREKYRYLMKYVILEPDSTYVTIDISDEILCTEVRDAELHDGYLDDYRSKVEYYINKNEDADVIKKLRTNMPLAKEDIEKLEEILWKNLGTQEDYKKIAGEKPLGIFVREIVGLDMNVAKEAFSKYLDENIFDANQIYFVNKIVEYIVEKGVLEDRTILMMPIFSERGSFANLFDQKTFDGILDVLDNINNNAGIGGVV